MKFRIVELFRKPDGQQPKRFVIQKRNFWGVWREVFAKEVKYKRICHASYQDAEAYMLANYIGDGSCEKIGVEYKYTRHNYVMP